MMQTTQPPMPPPGGDMMNRMQQQQQQLQQQQPPQQLQQQQALAAGPRGSPFQSLSAQGIAPTGDQYQHAADLSSPPQLSAFNPPPQQQQQQQNAAFMAPQMYGQFARPPLVQPASLAKPPSAFNYPQGPLQPPTQPQQQPQQPSPALQAPTQAPPTISQYQQPNGAPPQAFQPPNGAPPQAFQPPNGAPPQAFQPPNGAPPQGFQPPPSANLAQQMSNMSINSNGQPAPTAFNNTLQHTSADHGAAPPSQLHQFQPPPSFDQQQQQAQANQYNPTLRGPPMTGPAGLPQQQQPPQPNQLGQLNGQLPQLNQYNPQAPPPATQPPPSMMQRPPLNTAMAPPPVGQQYGLGQPSLSGPSQLYGGATQQVPPLVNPLQKYPGRPPQVGADYGGAMQPPPNMMMPGQPGVGLQQQPYMQQPQPQFDQLPQQPQQQQSNSRMDMDQMPNPIEVMNVNTAKFGGSVFETNEPGKLPPLTSTDFVCRDLGNCYPRFIRSSVYSIPANPDLIKQSKMPMAIALTPFAELKKEEREPPVSNLGELGPVRCKRCKAYMSPFMQFIDNGRRFQCPFCDDATQVPQEYFNHLDHMGKRIDQYERPELSCGSYEFVATKDYCRNQQLPQPPAFVFMIDVSVNSVRSGLLHVLCPYLKNVVLPNLPRDRALLDQLQQQNPQATVEDLASLVRVGFVTYDKELHFYNLKSTLAAPQMMIVSDVEEVFVPMLDGFLVSPAESKAVIDALLDSLPGMFAESKETEIVLAPVVEAGLEALKAAKCAGKLFVFHTNLPNALAPGQLKNRDDKKLLGTDKEKSVLTPQNEYYAQLGKRCVENGCGVDLFLLPNQHCDVATLADLTRKVAGQIYKYDFFMADAHGQRLCEDLRQAVESTVAFDAVMKVRTSTGIKPNDYLGNFNMYGNDVEFASLTRQYSMSVELKHEDKINENAKVYIQAALLYTSLSGQRRIRLHNLALNVCTQYTQMYPSCEVDALINYMATLAARSVTVSTPKSIYENLVQQVSHILACYRKNCTNAPAKGQFILPETLKLLPLFANSLLKSDPISGAQTVSVDERSWLLYRLASMDIQSTYALFYPRLLPVNEMQSPESMPNQMRCLYEKLKEDGIYLLENGLTMYLWLGQNVDQATIQNLFGVSGAQLNVEKCKLLEIDTPISKNVRSLIRQVQEQRRASMKLVIVRQRDSLEPFFKNYLVEDMGFKGAGSSYVDFLYLLHKEIKNILS